FAGPAEHLAHLRAALAAGERFERLGGGIEADDGVGQEIGEPDFVLFVDIDGITAAARVAGQEPRLPGLCRGIVAADLAGVPEAHPEHALGVRPYAPGASAFLVRL